MKRLGQLGKRLGRSALANPRQALREVLIRLKGVDRRPPLLLVEGGVRAQQASARISVKPTANRALPIVFIHRSASHYLSYTFAQARKSNPASPIYLLGDSSNTGYELVQHCSMFDYFKQAAEFRQVYKHYSTNSFDYELINFQRWFVLREFLIANDLPRCLYLDSDTMLYADVTEEAKKFQHFDFTLSQMMSGCTFFLNRLDALTDFCSFLMDIYSGKAKYYYDKMIAHYTVRKMNRLAGGVCDMTAFQLYHELHFGEIGEVAQIIDGSVYDPAITTPAP
ncbi:MAG TPA: hypothetical protein VNN13_01325, partial [Methylomirabilota bacterium]|nr:hypothetical protein [Methylomirabilota bacterium]